jgi:cobalamin-dependent methionine synthase I
MAKYSRSKPTRALIMQAIGTERVEALLDMLTEELKKEYGKLRPRFSVGYGDAPLAAQREITARLDTARQIGVSLSDSLIMTPTKSVTAIIGIDT